MQDVHLWHKSSQILFRKFWRTSGWKMTDLSGNISRFNEYDTYRSVRIALHRNTISDTFDLLLGSCRSAAFT